MSLRYLLDTNVISAPFSAQPDGAVMRGLQEHSGVCGIASVTWHELRFGHALLPDSKRKEALESYIHEVVLPTYPVLVYDRPAADWHARERSRLRKAGREPSFADAQIAAIAATNDLVVVTRNVSDFAIFDDLTVESWHGA